MKPLPEPDTTTIIAALLAFSLVLTSCLFSPSLDDLCKQKVYDPALELVCNNR